jgi:cobalt/nickel transport system permease protein
MAFDQAFYSIGRLDRLSYQDTFVHRLDARAKVIAAMLFILTVVSFSKYEVLALVPFLLFPVVLMTLGDLPVGFFVKKVLLVSPFAVFIGIFNPLFDTHTAAVLFGVPVSAGWTSFASILLKFLLTISAALILIATTSFPGVCQALRRLGVPALFVSQLLFLYRYLFVLLEETMRIVRARDLRSFGKRGLGANTAVRIIGALFLRTVERAERVYRAMLSRGFRGELPVLRRTALRPADVLFLFATAAFLAVFRLYPLGDWTGRFAQELLK